MFQPIKSVVCRLSFTVRFHAFLERNERYERSRYSLGYHVPRTLPITNRAGLLKLSSASKTKVAVLSFLKLQVKERLYYGFMYFFQHRILYFDLHINTTSSKICYTPFYKFSIQFTAPWPRSYFDRFAFFL